MVEPVSIAPFAESTGRPSQTADCDKIAVRGAFGLYG